MKPFAIASLIALSSLVLIAQQEPIVDEQLRVRLVELDVRVMDLGGNPVTGLGPEDFTIIDNGERRTIDSFEEVSIEAAPIDPPRVMLLIDYENISFANARTVFPQLRSFVSEIGTGSTEVGLTVLADDIKLVQGFTTSSEDLLAGIDTAEEIYGEVRNHWAAVPSPEKHYQHNIAMLRQLVHYLGAYHGSKHLIILSDHWQSETDLARNRIEIDPKLRQMARFSDLKQIQTAGLFGKVTLSIINARRGDLGNLVSYRNGDDSQRSLADLTGGFHYSPGRARIAEAVDRIIDNAKRYYRIRYYAERDVTGYRPVRVVAKGLNRIAHTSGGYYGGAIGDLTEEVRFDKLVAGPGALEIDMPTDWLTWTPTNWWSWTRRPSVRKHQATVIVGQRAFDEAGMLVKEEVTTVQLTKRGLQTPAPLVATLTFDSGNQPVARLETTLVDMGTGERVVLRNEEQSLF